MQNLLKLAFLALFTQLLVAAPAFASQFFVFAVKEVEGVSKSIPPEKRPLIDRRVREILRPEIQQQMVSSFAQQIATAYPTSTVHAKQVRNTRSTKAFQYVDDDSQQCGANFIVPVQQSYAAVIGITRGSWYEVVRPGGVIEVLIPITLNLQLVKPDRAKVVYSVSETLYSTFRFANRSELQAALAKLIPDNIVLGLNQQMKDLTSRLKAGFQPKETIVTLIGRSGGVLVADKGFEVGFVDGDIPVAINRKTGAEVIFTVLAAESGYTILAETDTKVSVGDEFIFKFEEAANDSRKPRVMPVVSMAANDLTGAIADLFAKDIGFGAAFQIAAVDANFKDTQDSIERMANCVAWKDFESVRKDFESRQDAPDFFLKFDYSFTPVFLESGAGGVETRESFVATVAAMLVDRKGTVIHAEIGQDFHRLVKKGGRGLDINNAREVALKNATSAAAKKFLSNVKFQSAEFPVTVANKSSFSVDGLSVPEDTDLVYEVLRPLDVRVGGKPTFWRLSFDPSDVGPKVDGNRMTIGYLPKGAEIKRGDRLIVANMPKRGQTRLSDCPTHYVAPGSDPSDFLIPVVRHSAYASQRFQIIVSKEEFYSNANALLQEGKFKLKVSPPAPTEVCLRPGYLVKREASNCSGNECSFEILSAATIILEKAGQRVGNFVQAERISAKGVAGPQVESFTSFRASESVSNNLPKLIEKLNQGK